ncbi:hypothetical protein AAZX31_15G257200 [Glycine max]|nr:hypothetical protein GYH30_043654 [Glycine max]
MTNFRRLARTTAPHFALGRNRELQGLARAMVKLWETSAIAKLPSNEVFLIHEMTGWLKNSGYFS